MEKHPDMEKHPEMALKKPYNRIAKDKVTLAFVGLLYKPQKGDLGVIGRVGKPL